MASSNIARLGVVLALDTAAFTADVNKAIAETKNLKAAIQRESNAAAKEIIALKYATEDYGKEVSKVTQIEREIAAGRFKNASPLLQQQLLAQAKAYDDVAKSAKSLNAGLNDQQKLALTYQTTDLVTQIASGQNALIALMQQGGQLKDQMGGIGPMFTAIRMALTPMVLGMTAAAAAVGTLGFAFYQGAEESADLRDQLILTGNYANLTQKTFLDLANTVSIKTNLSIGKTKDILMELVKSGKFTDESMGSVAQAIANVAKLSGETASEVAQKLIPAFDGGASSIKSLNDKMHFLTLEQYKHIVLLDKQGKAQEAAKIAADALNQKLGEQERKLGDLESVWEKLKNTASATWNALLNIGRPKAPEEEIEQLTRFIIKAQEQLNKANPDSAYYDKLANDLQGFVEKRRLLVEKMEANDVAARAGRDETQRINDEAKNGEKRLQLNAEIDAAIIKNRADAQKFASDEERKIFIDAEAAKQIAIRATIEKNRAEGNVFEAENARKLAQELIQIERQKQEQLKQIAERRAQLVFEREKLEAKNAFDVKRQFASDIQLIEIDAQEKLESARSEIANKNRVERNLFAKENARILAQQEIAIEQEKQNKLRELAKRRYAADMTDRQNVADQVMADLAQEESRKSQLFNSLVEQGQKEKESLDYEMQKLQLKQGLIGASDEALQIAMSELETQRRIAEIMANPDLSPEKKDQLVGQAKKTQGMREMFISMQEGLKNTQQIYDSVFGNMERALENFVRTGKLSFKDLARSIIQDLILIQMRAAASTLFSTFMKAIGFASASDAGTITGSSGIKFKAAGGPVNSNSPYIGGERGPELFVPRNSGTIIPNNAMAMSSGPQVVNNYNIQAIDVKSFEDRIMGSNRAVWAANSYANKTLSLGQGRV